MRRIALVLLIPLLIAGCQEAGQDAGGRAAAGAPAAGKPFLPAGSDEEQVRQIVARYDQLLAEGYRTLNMSRLAEVASQDQAEKAYIHMAAIGEGKARMLSNLKKLEYTGLKREAPESFVVRTRELWDFAYTDIKTGKETGKVSDFVYEVTYTLKKSGPRWVIVDSVASAPDDKEEQVAPRAIRPAGQQEAAAALPPGHRRVGE